MFRFTTTEQVLFECEARVHLLGVKRLQLISECSSGRELLCGTFLSAQESTICRHNKEDFELLGCPKPDNFYYKLCSFFSFVAVQNGLSAEGGTVKAKSLAE